MIRNEVFSCFVFYGVLLVVKMYVIAIITGQVRLRRKAFANPEDALRHGGLQYHREDPYVERCRRSRTSSSKDVESPNAQPRGRLSARSTTLPGPGSELDKWTSSSGSLDSDVNLLKAMLMFFFFLSLRLLWQNFTFKTCNLSLFVDVSARPLSSSSMSFLLILRLAEKPSDFPLGSSVKPV
uniref:Uncharacterized protein n=1 Tax=Gouania willdenowi TaxID=441366 RepID=A0A8C5EIK2_GOUWI